MEISDHLTCLLRNLCVSQQATVRTLYARQQKRHRCIEQSFGQEEPEIKLPTFAGSKRKQGNSRKISTSVSATTSTPLTVDHHKLWKALKEMGIQDHLTCLLRNLCVGQTASVRTLCGTTDSFKIEKGVRQGCILSPCLFNFYAEYFK